MLRQHNAEGMDGLTPLSLAVRMGSIESTKILLEHGSCVNSRDKNGKSPLHYAAEAWNVHKIVKLLIQYGADVNSRDMLGMQRGFAILVSRVDTASVFE
jgi:ankyrin repeat protein